MDSGIIDALFLDQQGQWHVVEFKSDQVPGHVSLSAFIGGSDYEHQVYRYRRAVRELLHVRPIAHLVLLDFHGQLNIAQLM